MLVGALLVTDVSSTEKLIMFLVLVVEALNSAIEAVVDLVTKEPKTLAGRAKDYGSSAVLLANSQVVIVWFVILFEHYFF